MNNTLWVMPDLPKYKFGGKIYLTFSWPFKWAHQINPTENVGLLAWLGREFEREWMKSYICIAESLHCSLETITTLLISYNPI